MPYEGYAFTKWLASEGYVGIILKYRLPNTHKEVPFDDALEAMIVIRQNADKWNIDTSKIGVAGFSTGGHLAVILSNMASYRKINIRPDFTILFYLVISFTEATKGGTRNNLLGMNPSSEDIRTYSAELRVTDKTPSTIIFTADDDGSVPPTHSTIYYDALKKYRIPASLYIFPTGGHGWAMLDSFGYKNEALNLLKSWLTQEVLAK